MERFNLSRGGPWKCARWAVDTKRDFGECISNVDSVSLIDNALMPQESYPDTRKKINSRLNSLRDAGVELTLTSIHGIMVACIEYDAPHLFTQTMSDGTRFKCSESFV